MRELFIQLCFGASAIAAVLAVSASVLSSKTNPAYRKEETWNQ